MTKRASHAWRNLNDTSGTNSRAPPRGILFSGPLQNQTALRAPEFNADTAIMAPGFDQLSDHDYDDELENIDFSDLKERYDVRMEEGLDTFVVYIPQRRRRDRY